MHQTPVPCEQDFSTVQMEPLSLFYVRPWKHVGSWTAYFAVLCTATCWQVRELAAHEI